MKHPPSGDREALQQEAQACYRIFVAGLLDLTDNYVGATIVPPARIRRHDGDDPYLVVAADKGTATFSDIANELAQARQFWLGDAFASGGSNGYDHKQLAITARGVWVSVERHFIERGVDVSKDTITVVGIGDMSGDVFGNGLLRSTSVKLLAAFNHLHIFIDPDPDPLASFRERQRLFAAPRSSWSDYDERLLSTGGAVYSRQQKSIVLSVGAHERLGVQAGSLTPDQLIHELLKAPVDLLWNGGIGTYVKGTRETHAEVGDRANDAIRVNADESRCRVFAEGGNLGMRQAGRVDFSLAAGACNTDFIDNSAGVDCSDHEVNIKIALGLLTGAGEMTLKQRNELLAAMSDEVAGLWREVASDARRGGIRAVLDVRPQTQRVGTDALAGWRAAVKRWRAVSPRGGKPAAMRSHGAFSQCS